MGVTAGTVAASRFTGAAPAAAAKAPIPWQAKQAEQVKKALELQKKMQASQASIFAAYNKAPAAAKTPGFMGRVAARGGRVFKAAAPITRGLGKVAGVAGKALGPIGLLLSAGLAVPALVEQWKKARGVGGKAKAVGNFALEASGANMVGRTGVRIGNYADEKTRKYTDPANKKVGTAIGKLAYQIQSLSKTKSLTGILDDIATLGEEDYKKAGVTREDVLAALNKPEEVGQKEPGQIETYMKEMKEKEASKKETSVFAPYLEQLQQARKQQQEVTIGMSEELMRQAADTMQDGKYSPLKKSMSYTLQLPLTFNMETLGAAAFAAYQRPNSTGGAK